MQIEPAYPETADIETSSDDYARRFAGPVGEWFLSVQREAALSLLNSVPHGHVLEVGGGHGQLTEALLKNGCRVTVLGSDASCQNRIRHLIDGDRCRFEAGNLIDVPFPDRAFDVVLSFRLLPHVQRWPDLIRELTRTARHAVIVDYPTVRSLNYFSSMFFGLKKKVEKNTRPYRLFRDSEVSEAFYRYGYFRGERFSEFFFPMVLHRLGAWPGVSVGLEAAARAVGATAVLGSPVIARFTPSRPNGRE